VAGSAFWADRALRGLDVAETVSVRVRPQAQGLCASALQQSSSKAAMHDDKAQRVQGLLCGSGLPR